MLKKKRVSITFFDAICMLVGRVVFWMLLTIVVGVITLYLVKGFYAFMQFIWPFILNHIVTYLLCLVGVFCLYNIWSYIKYDIQVLNIDGHKIILRKRLFTFLRLLKFGVYTLYK